MNARKLGWGIIALVVILAAGWLYQEPIQQKWRQYTGPELSLQGVQVPLVQPVPARVASAPRAHVPASAPAPAIQASVLATGDIHQAQVASQPKTHTVKTAGETLSKIGERFGYDWRGLCAYNDLSNCHVITIGQVIKLGTVHKTKPQIATVPTKAPKAQVAAPALERVGGEIPYRVVGSAPLNGCGKKSIDVISEEAWTALGLSEEDKAYLRQRIDHTGPRINITTEEGRVDIRTGMRIEQVTFCHKGSAVAIGPMRTVWDESTLKDPVLGERFVLPSGRALVWMRNCFNWITWQPPEKPVEPPPVEEIPPVVPPQELPPEEESPIIPTEPQVPKEEKQRCPINPRAVFGQEHEPKHSGNDSHSTFLTAALTCTWRGENGTHGVGVGTQDSWWNGKVNLGAGRYSGNLVSFGPAYEYISDNSWTFEGKLLFGRINENFRQGDYASHREIDFVGPSLSLNLYERRERGEKWLPETRLFAMAGWATDVRAGHTWQGKRIDDTKELSEFGGLFQAGVHQDFYDFKQLTLWGRLGYFREDPSSETANLRIGISDSQRICGVGIGTDFDLKNGGEAFGWGWWCDGVKGVNVARTEYRLNQVTKEHNVTFEEDGTAMVPVPPPNR